MTTRADTIARHLSVFETHLRGVACGFSAEERLSSASDAAAALREAIAALGGAAVASEAAGPKTVRRGIYDVALREDDACNAEDSVDGYLCSLLPGHPGPHVAFCNGADDLPEAEPCGTWAPAPTPEPPKPAGWVVRWGIPGSYRFSQGIGVEFGVSDPTDAHVYTSKADAEADARTVKHEVCVLPVDAAGNVIEAEDIGATLRREECERKAARQSGMAWEAARAGEAAERLRAELAAAHERIDECAEEPIDKAWSLPRRIDALDSLVDTIARKEERDAAQVLYSELRAERDAAQAESDRWQRIAGHRQGRLDACGERLRNEVARLTTARAALAAVPAGGVGREEAERLRAELAAVKAERDEARGELQWQVRPANIAVSTDGSSVEALHVPSGVRVRGGSRSEVLYRCQEERAAKAETERDAARTILAAIKAERDEVRAERDKWAANAGTLNASLRQVHTECDQLRAELDATLAERDALAAEVQRSREQQPVRWAVVNPYDAIVCIYTDVDLAKRHSTASGYRVAPLYLAPVARDHSGVIAQCEEALALHVRLGCGDGPDAHALRAALAALRGAS